MVRMLRRNGDSVFGVGAVEGPGEASQRPVENVLSLHFPGDGRSHCMWFVNASCPPDQIPVDLWAHWRLTPDGVSTCALFNRRDRWLEGVLLTEWNTPTAGHLPPRLGRGQASLLASLRHRPLLVTVALRGDIEPAKLRLAHHILVRAALEDAAPEPFRHRARDRVSATSSAAGPPPARRAPPRTASASGAGPTAGPAPTPLPRAIPPDPSR